MVAPSTQLKELTPTLWSILILSGMILVIVYLVGAVRNQSVSDESLMERTFTAEPQKTLRK